MHNPHNFQQQPNHLYQQHPQQLLQQPGQPMGQPMYGYAQAGMPQQFLQQQQAMAGNRPAAVAAPGIPQQQQLQGMAGMQHHRLPHQQVQQQQQPVAAANQDDEWDLNAIPSDEDDDAGLPAQPATQVSAAGAGVQRPTSAVSGNQQPAGHMAQPLQLSQQQQQQAQQHLQPHTRHLALQQQQQRAAQLGQHGMTVPGPQAGLAQHQGALAAAAAAAQLQQRPAQLPAAGLNKHMSSVRPGQQVQQPRAGYPTAGGPQQLMHMHAQNAQQLRAQQQLAAAQKAAVAAAAGSKPASEGPPAKRQKTADALPPAPEDAQSLYEVLYKAEKAGAGILKAATAGSAAAAAAAAGAPGSVAAAAAAAATVGSAADGPVTSIDELLRRAEAQAGRAALEPAGRGRGGADKAADEDKLIAESALKRLMELQTLNRAFKLQPELVEQLQRLTDSFVSEAVKFGVGLASHRRGAVLRPTDLATYLERTHHLHVPGFTKEYHPYRRPAASELHKERSILVRKAQLTGSQAGGDGAAPAGGGRGAGAGGD